MPPTWAWPPPSIAVLAVPLARVLPLAAGPVEVVGTGRHQLIEVGIEVVAVHPLEVRAGDHAEQVRDHAVGDERLAEVVEVEAPGVGRAVGDDLEDLAGRVIPPDAAVHRHPLLVGRARLADAGRRQDAVAAPEPSVRAPLQGVEQVVLRVDVPAVELDDRRAVGPVVAVAVGEEQQVRRGADPDPAEPQLDAGEVGALVVKDGPAVEAAVAVGVLEDQDAILAARPAQPDRVRRSSRRPRAVPGGRSSWRSAGRRRARRRRESPGTPAAK